MTAYLLVVGDREALGWILTESRTAFPSAGRSEVSALSSGDALFLYTTRGAFKNPTRDRGRVIGGAQVTTPVVRLDTPVRFGEREFPVGCDLALQSLAPLGEGVELAPLVGALETFRSAGSAWSVRLRRPLVRLSDDDETLLTKALARVAVAQPDPTVRAEYTRWYELA